MTILNSKSLYLYIHIYCDSRENLSTLTILYVNFSDNEEKLYWDKIEQDRKEKLHNKKRFKHRGRDKLLKRAEKELGKYIKFDQV